METLATTEQTVGLWLLLVEFFWTAVPRRRPLFHFLRGSIPSLAPLVPDSWLVLILSSISLSVYARLYPPGPSFTYAWLWLGALSFLVGSTDAKALFYLVGFGLVCGWYTIQLVHRDVWDRILVYWLRIFPPWCASTGVRTGDILIHIIPFAFSMNYFDKCSLQHLIQAICYERMYFYTIEGQFVGDGKVANKIYALHPPCAPRIFKKLQMLSTVGYCFASSVCASTLVQKRFLQAFWLGGLLVIGSDSAGDYIYSVIDYSSSIGLSCLDQKLARYLKKTTGIYYYYPPSFFCAHIKASFLSLVVEQPPSLQKQAPEASSCIVDKNNNSLLKTARPVSFKQTTPPKRAALRSVPPLRQKGHRRRLKPNKEGFPIVDTLLERIDRLDRLVSLLEEAEQRNQQQDQRSASPLKKTPRVSRHDLLMTPSPPLSCSSWSTTASSDNIRLKQRRRSAQQRLYRPHNDVECPVVPLSSQPSVNRSDSPSG